MNKKFYPFIRPERYPHRLCPGCGHGIIQGAVIRALSELELNMKELVRSFPCLCYRNQGGQSQTEDPGGQWGRRPCFYWRKPPNSCRQEKYRLNGALRQQFRIRDNRRTDGSYNTAGEYYCNNTPRQSRTPI